MKIKQRKTEQPVSYLLKAPCSHCGQWGVDDMTMICSRCGEKHDATDAQIRQRNSDMALQAMVKRRWWR